MDLNVIGADALKVSDVTFGVEFNEALVHQQLLRIWLVPVRVLVHRRLAAM